MKAEGFQRVRERSEIKDSQSSIGKWIKKAIKIDYSSPLMVFDVEKVTKDVRLFSHLDCLSVSKCCNVLKK